MVLKKESQKFTSHIRPELFFLKVPEALRPVYLQNTQVYDVNNKKNKNENPADIVHFKNKNKCDHYQQAQETKLGKIVNNKF